MPGISLTNGQTFSPSNASGLNRRQVRKHLLDSVVGLSCRSHVDGSLTCMGKRSQVGSLEQFMTNIQQEVSSLGLTLKWLRQSNAASGLHEVVFATTETVQQGLCGAHGYRGEGQYALSGQKHEAWNAEPQAEPTEPQAEPTEPQAEPTEPQASSLTRDQLKAICASLGLATGGSKAVLQARIRAYQEANS